MGKMRQVMAKKKNAENRILRLVPNLPKTPGIYVFFREDESGIKHAYVGQAKNLLSRCRDHLLGYDAIDLSIRKHGLYAPFNIDGYKLIYKECPADMLDENERNTIFWYAHKGYQLKNKTSGGQGEGKIGINDNRPSRGYHDGLEQGRINTLREVREYFEKYLIFLPMKNDQSFKKDGTLKEIYKKKYIEFKELIYGSNQRKL